MDANLLTGARRAEKTGNERQIVLVLQGGGALGAYQAGVYHALHEHGIEPDWIIGTSIGAINASLIAGNPTADRLERLQEFWTHEQGGLCDPYSKSEKAATVKGRADINGTPVWKSHHEARNQLFHLASTALTA